MEQRKRGIKAVLFFTLIPAIGLGILVILFLWLINPRWASTSSPDGTYKVKLYQEDDHHMMGWRRHWLYLTAQKQGGSIFEDRMISKSGTDYFKALSDWQWTTPTTLWAGKNTPPIKPAADDLLIRNLSPQMIRCLIIEILWKKEMWVLFDIPPGASQTLQTFPQLLSGDRDNGIFVEVWFENGTNTDDLVEFIRPDNMRVTTKYCITINEKESAIVNSVLTGKPSQEGGKSIAPSSNCAQSH